MRGLKKASWKQTQRRKVCWREEQTNTASDDYTEARECVRAAAERRPLWLLKIQTQGEQTKALVDTGASRSFVVPSMVANLKLPTDEMDVGVRFPVASGSELVVRTAVRNAKFRSGDLQNWADVLAAQLPYAIILGTDWLCRELVVCDFGHRRLMV